MEAGSEAYDAPPVTGDQIRRRLEAIGELGLLPATAEGEVAERWAWADGGGEVGFITPVSRPFCGGCTRGRLSADGRFFTCLFASSGIDLRSPLRDGARAAEVEALLRRVWALRRDRHCEARSEGLAEPRPARMAFLGG
jgi:cyclic pyranopterin phosphate synthase